MTGRATILRPRLRIDRHVGLAAGRWVGILAFLVFALFPCYWMLVSSLRPQPELFAVPPRLLPGTLTLEWYQVVLRATRMPRYFLILVFVSTASMIVSLPVVAAGGCG